MKTRVISIGVLLALLCGSGPVAAETARIVTKENAIRSGCRFFAPVKVKLRYNDLVTIISRSGDWLQVSFKGTQGCLHRSAVETKGFRLTRVGNTGSSASSDEVALAGKGFNPQVEAAYRKNNPNLNFQAVDTIEHLQVSPDALQNFMENGGLNLP